MSIDSGPPDTQRLPKSPPDIGPISPDEIALIEQFRAQQEQPDASVVSDIEGEHAIVAPEAESPVQALNKPVIERSESPTPRRLGKKGLAAITAGAVGIVGATVFAFMQGDESPENVAVKSPVAEAPQTPGQQTPETTTPSATPTPTPEKSPEISLDLDTMSPESFAELPEEIRTDYALAKYFILSENGSLFDFLDQNLTNGKTLFDYNPYQTPLDRFATGDDILLAHTFAEQITTAWKPDITTAGGGDIDPVTAEKLISGYAFNPNSRVYQSHIDSIRNSTAVARLSDATINGMLVINTTALQEVQQDNGNIYSQKELTVVSNGNTYKETYVFVPKEELGEGNGLWLLSSREKVKL